MTTEMTFEELKAMDSVELVKFVRDKLLAQGKKSWLVKLCDSGSGDVIKDCAYRGKDGLKCAAGWLIPDDMYKTDFESCGWRAVVSENPELQFATPKHPFKDKLILEMQEIHDFKEVNQWEEEYNHLINSIQLDGAYGGVGK